MTRTVAALLLLAFSASGFAQEAPPAAQDPVLEKRVMALSEELRCLVCQNQSLADSNAGLAVDLRDQVRELMQAGKSDQEIREFMVDRYGDFVLYNPPMKPATLVLWAGPFVLLVAAAAFLGVYLRRRAKRIDTSDLSADERARARNLLDGDGSGGT